MLEFSNSNRVPTEIKKLSDSVESEKETMQFWSDTIKSIAFGYSEQRKFSKTNQ